MFFSKVYETEDHRTKKNPSPWSMQGWWPGAQISKGKKEIITPLARDMIIIRV